MVNGDDQYMNKRIDKLLLVGVSLIILGVTTTLGSLIFNWLTISNGSGANIGAGILFIIGVLLILCGMVTYLIVVFLKTKYKENQL